MTPQLEAHETALIGAWLLEGGNLTGNSAAKRINYLTENHLVQVAQREEGWTRLFRDPADGRFWELTYPQSHMHGGGPPRLDLLSTVSVKKLYGDAIQI